MHTYRIWLCLREVVVEAALGDVLLQSLVWWTPLYLVYESDRFRPQSLATENTLFVRKEHAYSHQSLVAFHSVE